MNLTQTQNRDEIMQNVSEIFTYHRQFSDWISYVEDSHYLFDREEIVSQTSLRLLNSSVNQNFSLQTG